MFATSLPDASGSPLRPTACFGDRPVFSRLAVIALIAPAAVAFAAHPELVSRFGLDVWNVPDLRAQVEESAQRGLALDAAHDDVRSRIDLKETLVEELIGGRICLAEVAFQFMVLNEGHPEYMAAIRRTYRTGTDLQRTARNVVDYTLPRLEGETPSRQAEVTARLNAELADLLKSEAPAAH